ncbi:nuclear transport factor 2 family protein [Terriglobus sp. TAA 43]|uniref:nuclear transport factor 2 family protein n=1 Tax=Terriglobus sp. TAA 43 TaxID=278961 RepID=UPI00068ED005|nr:nuclear transport factor 2 family protein [Terriglobus sp. TAA 43]
MTAKELLRHTLEDIFSEPDFSKRGTLMREAYAEDCVWVHPGGRLVGIEAINSAAEEIRQKFVGYRYYVVGEMQEMQNVALCRWGSGIPGEPFHYTGTDVLEEREGRMTLFYTFIDGHAPMRFNNKSPN